MLGSLCHYVTHADLKDFQPMKANFGILPPLGGPDRMGKRERATAYAERALTDLDLTMRVADADRHHEQAKRSGAKILQPPTDHPYGERQYSAEDLGGHVWTFSQSIADVDPASWGGTLR